MYKVKERWTRMWNGTKKGSTLILKNVFAVFEATILIIRPWQSLFFFQLFTSRTLPVSAW